MSIALSVNLNKVALLRNSRGGLNPGPRRAAQTCLDAGASGITLHWRQDNRHTRESDVRDLRALCRERGAEFNLEGDLREELIALACEIRVDQCTLVPVTPGEVTSDHGFALPREAAAIMQPGDVVAHHGMTIHRADANLSATRHRRSFAMVYRGVSCRRDDAAYARYLASARAQHSELGIQS